MNWFFRYWRILMQYFNLKISTTQPKITVIEYVTNRRSKHLQLNYVRLGQTVRFTKPQTKSESLMKNWNVYFVQTNRKSYMVYQVVPFSITSNNTHPRLQGYTLLFNIWYLRNDTTYDAIVTADRQQVRVQYIE